MATTKQQPAKDSIGDGTQLINEFVDDHYKVAVYEQLAERVKHICETEKPEGIQAIITCRSKGRKSLRKKLLSMNAARKQPFQTFKEIEANIHDLAGVRIALYVPQQKGEVIKAINTWFPGAVWKEKRGNPHLQYEKGNKSFQETECASCRKINTPSNGSKSVATIQPDSDEIYNPIFAGYVADHARVTLSEQQAWKHPELKDWKKDQVVEIQIVSVLLHAWAEVEHDIVYKEIKAGAGKEERRILDSLNGFILASEVLLDQLHSIHTERVKSETKEFISKLTLAGFLQDSFIGNVVTSAEMNDLELKMLFGLLKALQKSSPQALRPVLKRLGFTENPMIDDLKLLGPGYTAVVTKEAPFKLASNMRVPYYIMTGILDELSSQDESCAQRRAGAGAKPNSVEDRMYRCMVLLSSFIWMDQLCGDGKGLEAVIAQAKVECFRNCDGENFRDPKAAADAFEWPYEAPARFNILNGRAASPPDVRDMDILWKWFERQEEHSFAAFAFRIAKLGVIGSFPDEIPSSKKDSQGSSVDSAL